MSTAYRTQGSNYPIITVGLADKLFYTIDYDVDPTIPNIIKHAVLLVLANLLKSDYFMNETGVGGGATSGDVSGFTSGKYSVDYHSGGDSNYAYNNLSDLDKFLTPSVKAMLFRYKVSGQNTM